MNARRENFRLALKLTYTAIADRRIDSLLFSRSEFPDVLATTWKELEGSIQFRDSHSFYLTYGIVRQALIEIPELQDAELKEKLGRLAAILKGYVTGRDEDAIVDFLHVAKASGLPEGFVYNAIECDLFDLVLHRQGAQWHNFLKGFTIEVPLNFGMEWPDYWNQAPS